MSDEQISEQGREAKVAGLGLWKPCPPLSQGMREWIQAEIARYSEIYVRGEWKQVDFVKALRRVLAQAAEMETRGKD